MKCILVILIVLCGLYTDSMSQVSGDDSYTKSWYYKKYNIENINDLSFSQLNSSLTDAKQGITVGSLMASNGVMIIALGAVMNVDVIFLRQLVIPVIGGAFIASGLGIIIVSATRASSIKKADNYLPAGKTIASIKPAICYNVANNSATPGISFSVIF